MRQIYHKPTWGLLDEAAQKLPPPFSKQDIVDWFSNNYPKIKKRTVISHITSCCVNDWNRKHFTCQKDILFKRSDGLYEKYDPLRHGQAPPQAKARRAQTITVKREGHREKGKAVVTSGVSTEEIEQRISKLCNNFKRYVESGVQKYTGPSVYFHCKTVDRFKELGNSVLKAANDERFLELLYATLVSWGMHNMMKGARMPDFETFHKHIAQLSPRIDELSSERITELSNSKIPSILDKVWELIVKLPGTETRSPLVANSKLLHHLIPQLVPPIDGGNTGLFFGYEDEASFRGGREKQKRIFTFIFPRLISIARNARATLDSFPYAGFDSSPTKVIDNAIIGFVEEERLKEEVKRKKEERKKRRMAGA